jgi:hypothetical protein
MNRDNLLFSNRFGNVLILLLKSKLFPIFTALHPDNSGARAAAVQMKPEAPL